MALEERQATPQIAFRSLLAAGASLDALPPATVPESASYYLPISKARMATVSGSNAHEGRTRRVWQSITCQA